MAESDHIDDASFSGDSEVSFGGKDARMLFRKRVNRETEVARAEHISLKYYGPALENHSISTAALAPALMYFQESVNAACKCLGVKQKVQVRIRATQAGSFDIQFLLQELGNFAQSTQGQGLEWLATVGGIPLSAILVGSVKLIKSIFKHGEIKKSEPIAQPHDESLLFNDGKATVTFEDDHTEEVDTAAILVSSDRRFVNSMGKACDASSQEQGIEGAILSDGHRSVDVDNTTAQAMSQWEPPSELLVDSVSRMVVTPLDAKFESDKKWRVKDADNHRYTAEMLDEDFEHQLQEGLRVGAKDTYIVDMRTKSYRTASGKLRNTYSIEKVIRIIPFEENNDNASTLFTD